MPALEAYRHMKEDLPDANCASAVIHALSPRAPSEEATMAVLDFNAHSLVDIAACITYEHARAGNYTRVFTLEEGRNPSHFFRDFQRQIRHTDDGAYFVGGLMATVEDVTPDERMLHVIGVMKHHKGRQDMFTVCDTSRMRRRDLIRRMTPREMDSRIIKPGVYQDFRALAMVGYPAEVLERDPGLHGDLSYFENESRLAEYRVYQTLQRAGLFEVFAQSYLSGS